MAGDVRAVERLAAPPEATVALAGSKSITNRALLCATLAAGRSELRGASSSDDSLAMAACVARLGANVAIDADEAQGVDIRVDGTAGALRPGPVDLDCRLAGTTARFVTALVTLGRGAYRIDGAPPLRARPMAPLHDALAALGTRLRPAGAPGHLPVVVEATGLEGGRVAMAGDVSSQFVTALMLVAPLTHRGIEIEVTTDLVSRPYLDITANVMRRFGAADVSLGDRRVSVAPGGYRAADVPIEPDASSASYLWAAAAITGGRIAVPGFGASPVQGDAAFVDVLERMGAEVRRDGDSIEVRGTGDLRGIEVDLRDLSDTVPTLAVVAACASGPTRITGIGFIRAKETDRIAAVAAELRRCGVGVDEETDGLRVRPRSGGPHGARIRTYQDHRIAMAFAVLGLRTGGVEIEDPDVVDKSFPGFWAVVEGLGRSL